MTYNPRIKNLISDRLQISASTVAIPQAEFNTTASTKIFNELSGTTGKFTTLTASYISASVYEGIPPADVLSASNNTFTGINTFNNYYVTASVGVTGSDAKFTVITASVISASTYVGISGIGLVTAVKTINTDTTLDNTYHTVLVDATSSNVTITLPSASFYSGIEYIFKKIDTSPTTIVTISGTGGELIDNSLHIVLNSAYESLTIISDGTSSWHLNSEYSPELSLIAQGYIGQVGSNNIYAYSVTAAGGINKSVQFNTGSFITGSDNLIYDNDTNTLSGTIAQFTQLTGNLYGTASNAINAALAADSQLLDGLDSSEFARLSTIDNTFTNINTFNTNYVTATVGITGSDAKFNSFSASQITSHLIPSTNETLDLGSATNKWRDLYLSGSTIYLGTAQLSVTDNKLSVNNSEVVTASVNGVVSTEFITASQILVNGDLRVLGTASVTQLNTLNQTSLVVGDKYITILSGGVDHGGIDGAGFLWGTSSGPGETTGSLGEHAHILYDAGRDALQIFPGLYVSGSTTTFNISGTTAQFTAVTASHSAPFGSAASPSYSFTDQNTGIFSPSTNILALSTSGSEWMRIDSAGRVGIGGAANAASKVELLGVAPSSGTNSIGIRSQLEIPSSTTAAMNVFVSAPTTNASSFTVTNVNHFIAAGVGIGAGSTATNQAGFRSTSGITAATNNYGFLSEINSGTGRYNFYAAGTAANYFAGQIETGQSLTIGSNGLYTAGSIYSDSNWGMIMRAKQASPGFGDFSFRNSADVERMRIDGDGRVGIGTAPSSESKLTIGGTLPSNTFSIAVNQNTTVPSSTPNIAWGFYNTANTEPASFTLAQYRHYYATQGTIGAGSSIVDQYGFFVESTLTGATNNYGFYSVIPSGTGRYNFYAAGTADNYFAGNVRIGMNVGIGRIPQVKLDISSSLANDGLRIVGNNSANMLLGINFGFSSYNPINSAGDRGIVYLGPELGNTGGSFTISPWSETIGGIKLDTSGNLGVAVASPVTRLDVNGTYASNIVAVAASDIDCSLGNYFTKTINGATTFTVSNVPASRNYAFTLELEHTSGAITWFSGVEWPGGSAPTLTTGKTHLFIFQTDNGGARWRASSLTNYTT